MAYDENVMNQPEGTRISMYNMVCTVVFDSFLLIGGRAGLVVGLFHTVEVILC